MTTADLLRDALIEIGVQDPIETVEPNAQSLALLRYNSILDQWNAQALAVYTVTFPTFSTVSGLNPHTIGPTTGTFVVTQRPVSILAANRILSSGTSLAKIPITVRDKDWYFANAVPNIQSGIPTDLYYSPSWENGSIYFWPVPNAVFTVELEVRLVLSQVTEADIGATVTWPPGYQRALMLTLAEDLVTPFTVPMPPKLEGLAREARGVIFANNNALVRIQTRQSGMPGGSGRGGGFNFRTGTGGGR